MKVEKIEVSKEQYGGLVAEKLIEYQYIARLSKLSDLHEQGAFQLGSLATTLKEENIKNVVIDLDGLPQDSFERRLMLIDWVEGFDALVNLFNFDSLYLCSDPREFFSTGYKPHISRYKFIKNLLSAIYVFSQKKQ